MAEWMRPTRRVPQAGRRTATPDAAYYDRDLGLEASTRLVNLRGREVVGFDVGGSTMR
jgi:hypothetical protein